MNSNEAAYLAALFEAADHLLQWSVGQPVAVIGEKYLFILDEMLYRQQSLADVAPCSRVDKGNAPVRRALAQDLNFLAKIRDGAIGARRHPVAKKILLYDVGLVAEAQNKITVAILAVVLH